MSIMSTGGSSLRDDILHFWFGALDEQGRSDAAHVKRWFTKDDAFDAEIHRRFSSVYASLAASAHRPHWVEGAEGLLAAIVVLDQFARNMFRGTPGMFAADRLARSLAFEAIALGYDVELPFSKRTFVYLPLMHSEKLAHQERCVELFQSFHDELDGDRQTNIANNLKYAIAHRDIVARFGRFPHRNQILERTSTDEELEFLKQPGSGF